MALPKRAAVVVGSINMDLVANAARLPAAGETVVGTAFQEHPGGKGANQAVAIARLGHPVHMIGRVGSDAFGVQLRRQLNDAGVGTSAVLLTEGASGVALIVVASTGENSIVVAPGANAALTPEDLDAQLELLRSAGIVLAQLETPLETVLHLAKLCRREGIPLVLDPAPAMELPPELLALVDWFTPNETEAAFYTGRAGEEAAAVARQLLADGAKGVVLKLGSRGSFVVADGVEVGIDSFSVKTVDTTAAGDCFNGAFAVGLLEGRSPAESARFAAAAAAVSVTREGAQPSLPARGDVEALLF